jgi:hypothetical protein
LGLSQLLDLWKKRRTGKLRWAGLLAVLAYLIIHAGVFIILSPVFARWVKVFELFYPPY